MLGQFFPGEHSRTRLYQATRPHKSAKRSVADSSTKQPCLRSLYRELDQSSTSKKDDAGEGRGVYQDIVSASSVLAPNSVVLILDGLFRRSPYFEGKVHLKEH